ncbi:MAG: hypothetical protein WCJ62_08075 [Flavobacterium sp.]
MKYLNNLKTIIVLVLLVEIVKFSIPHFIPFEELDNDDKISIFNLLTILIGGGWALFIYTKNSNRESGNFLKIYISATLKDSFLSINTRVKNKTYEDKKIFAAFLIITKQSEDIVSEVNKYLNQSFIDTNSFLNLSTYKTLIKEDFAFIQLPYYYSENLRVGNEHLSFSIAGIENTNINNLNKNIYEVRFFIYRKFNFLNPYHRCVQTCFVSDSKLNSLFIDLPEAGVEMLKNQKKNAKN